MTKLSVLRKCMNKENRNGYLLDNYSFVTDGDDNVLRVLLNDGSLAIMGGAEYRSVVTGNSNFIALQCSIIASALNTLRGKTEGDV